MALKALGMASRFPSKAWSCSELVLGASAIVDKMDGQATAKIVDECTHAVGMEIDGFSADEIRNLLKDCPARFVSKKSVLLFGPWNGEATDAEIETHSLAKAVPEMASFSVMKSEHKFLFP